MERAHAALTRILKLNSNHTFTNWHKYINLATFIHNTSYHTSIGCAPTVIFHGRDPVKPLDIRFYSNCIQKSAFNYDFVESLRDEMLKKFQNKKESLAKSFNRYRRYYDRKARANPLTEHTYCLLLNPRLTEQSAFSPKTIQKWLALYRVERVLTAANYLIRKTGTNYTQIVHRIRLRPIKPQYQVTDIEDINPENFQTDPTLGCYRGDQDFFDNGLPYLLDNDQGAPEKKIPNLDSPVRVSISFGAQPPQPLPAQIVNQPDGAAVTAEPASIHQAPRAEQPRRILTPPPYLTAQLPDSSEESDEYAENNTAPRRSTRIQEQQTKRLGERVLEVAGQQLQQPGSSKRTNQGQSVQARNFVNLLNNRRQQRQQMQFLQRLGATQEGTTSKKSRTDLNEIQAPKKTSQVTIVEDNLFGTSYSMGHCVSSDFFMGAGIAKRFDRLYPKMKTEACKKLTPGSVLAFYDFSRRWIYNLVTKPKYFHKPFYDALRNSLILMRNHAEAHRVKNIRLPELGCGLDNLQPPIVHKILHEVFQRTSVCITVCIRNDKVLKRNA